MVKKPVFWLVKNWWISHSWVSPPCVSSLSMGFLIAEKPFFADEILIFIAKSPKIGRLMMKAPISEYFHEMIECIAWLYSCFFSNESQLLMVNASASQGDAPSCAGRAWPGESYGETGTERGGTAAGQISRYRVLIQGNDRTIGFKGNGWNGRYHFFFLYAVNKFQRPSVFFWVWDWWDESWCVSGFLQLAGVYTVYLGMTVWMER